MPIILVNGISATGKTWVARGLGDRLNLPVFAKDSVKERLFDTLGVKDRAWAHQLSAASHAIINHHMEELLRVGQGFIIEANFNPAYDAEKYTRWSAQYDQKIIQILCHADGEVVYQRFKQRIERGERHPGHCDHENVAAFRDYLLAGRCAPLDVPGDLIEVDTTDFAQVDLDALAEQIKLSFG